MWIWQVNGMTIPLLYRISIRKQRTVERVEELSFSWTREGKRGLNVSKISSRPIQIPREGGSTLHAPGNATTRGEIRVFVKFMFRAGVFQGTHGENEIYEKEIGNVSTEINICCAKIYSRDGKSNRVKRFTRCVKLRDLLIEYFHCSISRERAFLSLLQTLYSLFVLRLKREGKRRSIYHLCLDSIVTWVWRSCF